MVRFIKLPLDYGDYCMPLYWLPKQSALDCFLHFLDRGSCLTCHKLTSD